MLSVQRKYDRTSSSGESTSSHAENCNGVAAPPGARITGKPNAPNRLFAPGPKYIIPASNAARSPTASAKVALTLPPFGSLPPFIDSASDADVAGKLCCAPLGGCAVRTIGFELPAWFGNRNWPLASSKLITAGRNGLAGTVSAILVAKAKEKGALGDGLAVP